MTGREMAFLAREVKAGLARGQSVVFRQPLVSQNSIRSFHTSA